MGPSGLLRFTELASLAWEGGMMLVRLVYGDKLRAMWMRYEVTRVKMSHESMLGKVR